MRKRTPPQKRISESKTRFNVACFGRQSGKTTYGLDKLLWKPLQSKQNSVYWHVLQTHSAAEVAFTRFCQPIFNNPSVVMRKPHESHKWVQLIGNRNIFFKSGENFEDLRTESLDGCIIDEARQQDSKLWPMIIRPMLSRSKGWCDFLSTPNGFDHFYDLFEHARDPANTEWAAHYAPSSEAWWWTPEEIASAKKTMTPLEFEQEIMAQFVSIFAGRTYTFGQENISNVNPFCGEDKPSKYIPILIGLDFNVNPMCWTLGQQKLKQFYWFDEIYIRNTTTQECAGVLVQKLKKIIDDGLKAEPQVVIVGDPAGNSRNTKSTESDFAIILNALKIAGIKYENRTPEKAPPVKERVNTVNTHLKSADGAVNMWIHPKCKQLKYDLERCSWKEGDQLILDKSNPDLTHSTDSIGYPIHVLSPLTSHGDVGRLLVIRR